VKIGEDSIHKICLQLSQICRFVDIGLYWVTGWGYFKPLL
jgi:hypothetical protein